MSQSKSRKSARSTKYRNRPAQSNLALFIVLGGILLVAAALFALWKAGQPAQATTAVEVKGQPSLKVDQDRLDFGDVKLGKTVTASFTLSNVGDKTLRINEQPYIEVLEGC
jgi:cell division septal protein FtsQ